MLVPVVIVTVSIRFATTLSFFSVSTLILASTLVEAFVSVLVIVTIKATVALTVLRRMMVVSSHIVPVCGLFTITVIVVPMMVIVKAPTTVAFERILPAHWTIFTAS